MILLVREEDLGGAHCAVFLERIRLKDLSFCKSGKPIKTTAGDLKQN